VGIEEIKAAIRKCTIKMEITPVLCGASFKNKGIQLLLDAVIDYLPAPTDVPAVMGIDPKTGNKIECHPKDEESFSALAFKIMADPYVGQLTFFRVYSGILRSGSYVYNSTKGSRERIGRLFKDARK